MQPDFYDNNRAIAYPLIDGTIGRIDGAMTLRRLPFAVIVDCGFVMGARAGYYANATVALKKITRTGDSLQFDFTVTSLPGRPISFTRSLTDDRFTYSTEESDPVDDLECSEPAWWGYLVTGDLSAVLTVLPTDGEILGADTDAIVEPGLIEDLGLSSVETIHLANDDRARATATDDCEAYDYPITTGGTLIEALCAAGRGSLRDVPFRPGYNATVTQNNSRNEIIFGAVVGAGLGEPCGEVPLNDNDGPPTGQTLYSGGPSCRDVVRSLGGVGGPIVELTAGRGTTVTPNSGANLVLVDITLGAE